MASIREGIISSLVTKLETITTGNGYEQNIGTVLDFPTHFESLDTADYPVVSIYLGNTVISYKLGGNTADLALNIGLRCYIEGGDEDTLRISANKIVEDISKMIANNITLDNSNVIVTEIVSFDPPFLWLELGHTGICDIQLNVIYRRNY